MQRMLADGGYVNAEVFDRVQQKVDLYVAIASEDNNYRRYDYHPPKQKPAKKVVDPRLVAMRQKLATEEGKRIYGKRASSVEPVFGIIKSAMDCDSSCCGAWRRSASSGTWPALHLGYFLYTQGITACGFFPPRWKGGGLA